MTREIGKIAMIQGDCAVVMESIPSESVDVILTDPPYLYLKNQKLDVPFDEQKVFAEFKRVLKPNGFVVMFGRGESFYRWNVMLSELGLRFKEEIVWDKSYCTSPLMAISRVHETVSIFTKGKGIIRRVKIPYLEMKQHDVRGVCQDIERMSAILRNPKSLDAVKTFLETNCRDESDARAANNLSISSDIKKEDRSVSVMRSLDMGMNEKTIIKEPRDHYKTIHPTQKPVRLLERLLQLCVEPFRDNVVVLDPFAGSMSTGEACDNLGFGAILIERDSEYYLSGCDRIWSAKREQTLF